MKTSPAPLSTLDPAGPVAQALATTTWVLVVGAALVFLIMMSLLAWVLRRRRAAVVPDERKLVRHWIVAGGLGFTGAVLLALLVYILWQTAALQLQRSAADPVIGVTARSWWWEVRYRDPASGMHFALANEIRIPVGQAVTIGVTSADVIHSLWVPALAGKIDMVPGRVHQLRLQASRPGILRGVCAEFCGEQHAKMAFHVVAMPPADYQHWLDAQSAPMRAPQTPLAVQGQQVFAAQRCSACHTVRGLAEAVIQPAPGPDLTHYASRSHLAAGTLTRDLAHTRRWLSHTQHVKPGARMPEFGHLDNDALHALAVFLEGLE